MVACFAKGIDFSRFDVDLNIQVIGVNFIIDIIGDIKREAIGPEACWTAIPRSLQGLRLEIKVFRSKPRGNIVSIDHVIRHISNPLRRSIRPNT